MKNSPVHKEIFEGEEYNIAYKVVTSDMQSLGLRKNPNIITYKFDEWLWLPSSEIVEGVGDYGGIWAARTPGRAKQYQKYMERKHDTETRAFKSLIGKVLFSNQDRVKTDGIKLVEELRL